MANIDYTLITSPSVSTLMVIANGRHYAFGASHPGQQEALSLVERHQNHQISGAEVAQRIEDIHSPAKAINAALRKVSTRFSYFDRQLRFDGDVIDKRITRQIIERIKAGDHNWSSLVNFMLRLAQNPSAASRRALYEWISDRHLTITQDGMVVGYKGVDYDGNSIHAGKGIVHAQDATGEIVTTVYQHDHLPNKPGTWVEFPRAEVDPDPNSHCSVGLHVGTASYARSFGSRLLTVLVDPAAVVVVPRDADGQKMRVWQYYITDIEPQRAQSVHTLEANVAFVSDTDCDDEQCEDCGEYPVFCICDDEYCDDCYYHEDECTCDDEDEDEQCEDCGEYPVICICDDEDGGW